VFRVGLAALAVAYVGMAALAPPLLAGHAQPAVLATGQLGAGALLVRWARAADPRDRARFTRFYMRVWALFFLEYAIVPLACLAA
jgi:homogentisate phytyltransferase/homogentisate geranylgeranyltransferase